MPSSRSALVPKPAKLSADEAATYELHVARFARDYNPVALSASGC